VNKYYPAIFYPPLILKFLVKNPPANSQPYHNNKHRKLKTNLLCDRNSQNYLKIFVTLIYLALIISFIFSILLLSPLWLVALIWISIGLGIFCFKADYSKSDYTKKDIFNLGKFQSKNNSKYNTRFPQREALLNRLLQGKILQPSGISEAKEGVSEKDFYQALIRIFPSITQGVKFDNPNYPYPYSADFVFVHTSGLSIDIEIDEPYVGHTKEPHHCIDQGKDDIRNQFFTSNNWVVVRFSEKQVVKYPYRCCKVIAKAIAKVTGDYTFLSRLQNTPDLPVEPMWNIKQAQKWASSNYRQTYLPIYRK
jgi:very-short-patch-repair endonuclease